jgi:hypothetical protein
MERQKNLEQEAEVKTSNWDYDLEKKILKSDLMWDPLVGVAGLMLMSVSALQNNQNVGDTVLSFLGAIAGAGFASGYFCKAYGAFQKLRDYKRIGL